MSEVAAMEVYDKAVHHRHDSIFGGRQVIQAWFGGTTVNVYFAVSPMNLKEVTCWSISDEEGRPVNKQEIDSHMKQHVEAWEEEGRIA